MLQPKNDDPISTAICVGCWTHVSDFNEFYCSVEKAHRLLTERFSLKGGEQQERINKSATGEAHKENHSEHSKEFLDNSEGDDDLEQDNDNAVEDLYDSESEAAASFSNEQFLNDVLTQQAADDSTPVTEPPNEPEDVVVKQEIGVVAVQERRETRATRAKSKANQLLAPESPPAEKATPARRRGRSKSEKHDVTVEERAKSKR